MCSSHKCATKALVNVIKLRADRCLYNGLVNWQVDTSRCKWLTFDMRPYNEALENSITILKCFKSIR